MSYVSSTSIRVVLGSIDGSLGVRTRTRIGLTNNFMLGRYLAENQKYELIACGYATTSPGTSPREEIARMTGTLRAVIRQVAEGGAKMNDAM